MVKGFSTIVLFLLVAMQASHTGAAPEVLGPASIDGVRVGSATMQGRLTGCTVVVVEAGAIGGVDVRGAAPGTRETDLLDPVNTVDQVHAVVLSGGSAFGLDAASGVMRYLEEKGIGWKTSRGPVPIVPAAVLYDLSVGDDPSIRPDADCGYRAAKAASDRPTPEGNVGAGAGATVGKLRGVGRAMKGGLGRAGIELPNGVVVTALIAVNAVGDVIDPTNAEVVAGVRSADGRRLADARRLLTGGLEATVATGENTTIGVVVTNARLTKAQAQRVAQVAQDGLARSIYPAHTRGDGDTLFVLATGAVDASSADIGALAAEVVARAVVRAVVAADGIPGYPSASDLGTIP